ncbi:MAG: hypothetical protein ACK5N7_05495 [Curvibacter sp.]
MKLSATLVARLVFLARVTGRESRHLQDTDARLFVAPFTPESARQIAKDAMLAERLDAFVARFSRLQDTLGDKLLPALLDAVGEAPGTAMDNLDRAERFGWIASADHWMEMRRLRNQMVHEYIEDPVVLADALNTGHLFVAALAEATEHCGREIARLTTK